MAKSSASSHGKRFHQARQKQHRFVKCDEEEEKSAHEKQADRLMDRQIGELESEGGEGERARGRRAYDWVADSFSCLALLNLVLLYTIDIPLYILLALLISHALSGTTSLSLPYLSTHLPHSLQTLLPAWARQLPILAPFATDLPNASHDSKHRSDSNYWTTGYAGPFRSDAAGFGHPLTALHNFTRACLGLSYSIPEDKPLDGTTLLHDDLRFGHSYVDRYPWNSWTSFQSRKEKVGLLEETYTKGAKDILFAFTFILLFTMVRALAIRYVLQPLGRLVVASPQVKKMGNNRLDEVERKRWRKGRRKSITRFAEQAWSATYYTCSLAFSIYVAKSEPYWLNEKLVWSQWPYTKLTGLTKVSSILLLVVSKLSP